MAQADSDSSESLKSIDRAVDYSITSLFCLEIALKILALGWKRKRSRDEISNDAQGEEMDESNYDASDKKEPESNPADLLTPEEHATIKAMFELFDTDNNLTMDEFELRVAMRGLGFGVTRQHAHRIFVSIDTDNSGSIDYDEFERMMAERMVKESPIDGFMDSDWNRLDLYLVVFRLLMFPLMFLPDGHGLFMNALARLLFLIRPLRVLDTFEGPSDILHILPRAVHSLRDLLCLFLLFVIILAIFCTSLFSGGTLHGRCIVSPNNTFATAWNARQTHYLQQHLADKTTANYADVFQRDSPVGELKIPEQFCSNDESCGVGFECSCRPPPGDLGDRSYLAGRPGCLRIPYGRMGETNNGDVVTMRYGYMGYNNFAQAFFTVFQVCTLSNWGEIMDATM